MIDLALSNLYLLGAALALGILTARWAFPKRPKPPTDIRKDEAKS